MSEPLLIVSGLCRSFGKVKAVDGLSFQLPEGEVVGFIGANGSGKTTTMRIICTLDTADEGRVYFRGEDAVARPDALRKRLGWMPDDFGVYPNMLVWEYIDFFARAYKLAGTARKERVSEVMHFTDLDPLADRPVTGLSKGQMQRLCLGRTLLNDPELLILDEPAAGLDPKARLEFKNLVRILKQRGKTLFISSHILSELGEMCDSLLFIDKGRLIHHGSAESLKYGGAHLCIVRLGVAAEAVEKAREWADYRPGVEVVEVLPGGLRLRIDDAGKDNLAAVLASAIKAGVPVCEYVREEQKLEEAFVNLLHQSSQTDRGN